VATSVTDRFDSIQKSMKTSISFPEKWEEKRESGKGGHFVEKGGGKGRENVFWREREDWNVFCFKTDVWLKGKLNWERVSPSVQTQRNRYFHPKKKKEGAKSTCSACKSEEDGMAAYITG